MRQRICRMLDEKTFLTRMAKKDLEFGQHWYKRNFNPWNVMHGDCLVRALSVALMMKYMDVCRHLGISFIDGIGQDERVTVQDVIRSDLSQYFGRPIGIERDDCTLDEFCELAWADAQDQMFVAFVKGRPMNEKDNSGRKADHAVYVCSDFDRPYFIDNWNSGNSFVYAALQVRKQVPPASKERLTAKEFGEIQRKDPAERQRLADMLWNLSGGK